MSVTRAVSIPRRVWLLAIAFVLLTTIPYIVGQFSASSGWSFRGVIFDQLDYYSHLAKMQQGARGEWLYTILFTSEPHPAILLQTFYVALGHVARWTGLSLPLTYHIARIFFAILMVLALYAFARRYLSERAAWWAVLLACFSGGFGFLVYLLPGTTISPIELWLIDAYIFFSVFTFPHFCAAIALLAVLMLAVDRWVNEGRRVALAGLVGGGFVMGFLQPFHVALVGLVLGIMTVMELVQKLHLTPLAPLSASREGRTKPPPPPGLRKNETQAIDSPSTLVERGLGGEVNSVGALLFGLILYGVAAGVPILYQLRALDSDPVWRSFSEQNVTLSPPLIYFILGWLPLLVPAFFGTQAAIRRRDRRMLLPILWALWVFPLLYLPINTPRRFSLAMQLPLAVLAVDWFARVAIPALRKRLYRRWRMAVLAYVSLSVLSTAVLLTTWTADATRIKSQYFVSELAAFDWIRANTPVQSVFVSDGTPEDNAAIGGMTGRRVVIGHWAETANFAQKEADVKRYFDPATPDNWRWAWLISARVDYVLVKSDPGGSVTPSPCLQAVYTQTTLTIYKVTPSCAVTAS